MDEIYAIAVAAGLVTQADADFLRAQHERPPLHPVAALLDSGVAAQRLLPVLAQAFDLTFLPEPVYLQPGSVVTPEHQAYFDCRVLQESSDQLEVAVWRPEKAAMVAQALANLYGRPVVCRLVAPWSPGSAG